MGVVHFKELKIKPDNNSLVIDAFIDPDYTEIVHFKNLWIDNSDTFKSEKEHSDTPIYAITIGEEGKFHYQEEITIADLINYKRTHLDPPEESITEDPKCKCKKSLIDKDIDFSGIIFVYLELELNNDKEWPLDIPCGEDKTLVMAIVVDLNPLYQKAMAYTRELVSSCNDRCDTPKDFIDYILKLRALEIAIKTGNYEDAIYYYNKFFKESKKGTIFGDRKGYTPKEGIKRGGCCCGNS